MPLQALGKTRLDPSEYTLTPPEGCKLKAGDVVTFTNEFGVSFSGKVVVGFTLPGDELHGRCVYLAGDAWWFPSHIHECVKEQTIPLEWQLLWDAMNANPDTWIDTTEHMFHQMLECVPPRVQIRGAFLCGEPYSHNSKGKAVYAAFRSIMGIVQAKYMTFDQFRKEVG